MICNRLTSEGKNGNNTPSNDRSSGDPISYLDHVNRRIIDLMIAEPKISQLELAKRLGMSQSSVAVRIDKLRKSKLISTTIGVDLTKLGVRMARVDVSTAQIDNVLNWAHRCPLFVNSSLGIGGENLSLLVVAEDIEMFQYMVEHHIRKITGVLDMTFNPILSWSKEEPVSLLLGVQKAKKPPCGMEPYCPRCPANPNYNGRIWVDGNRQPLV